MMVYVSMVNVFSVKNCMFSVVFLSFVMYIIVGWCEMVWVMMDCCGVGVDEDVVSVIVVCVFLMVCGLCVMCIRCV